MSSTMEQEPSILDKLDAAVPAPLAQFDAFPKLSSSYKSRSESRGFMTIFVALLAFLLIVNDIGEFIWGWPDHEFNVDPDTSSHMNVNVDVVVNMPCRFLSVDLRDAVGDRLFLSGKIARDGTLFDAGQATTLKEHSTALSARQAIAQSRSSRGLFSNLFRRTSGGFRPTYNAQPHGTACRVWGSLEVKKVTANLHITTLGHGYASHEHVDHHLMNLSHIINEFSFGPFFPDITQPLDYSFETTDEPFVAYQYFLHIVPTTYIAPRTSPLHTNQYSVTHYTRVLSHNVGTPGIFFKFDLDPLSLTIHQRTTTFIQFMIRCVGVVGGVFVCMGYAIRITTRAVEVVSGADSSPGIVAADASASGAKVGLRKKWGGGQLRARTASGKMVRQGSGWVLEGGPGSAGGWGGSVGGTPVTGSFASPGSPYMHSPSPSLSGIPPPPPPQSVPGTPQTGVGLGFPSSAFGQQHVPLRPPPRTPSLGTGSPAPGSGSESESTGVIPTAATQGSHSGAVPGTPAYGHFPPTPGPGSNGFIGADGSVNLRRDVKKDD